MTAKDLTQEQREWFVANFDHTKNQELADHLGTSPRSVTRMARELGRQCRSGEPVEVWQGNPFQAWHQPKGPHECRSLCRNAPSHW